MDTGPGALMATDDDNAGIGLDSMLSNVMGAVVGGVDEAMNTLLSVNC